MFAASGLWGFAIQADTKARCLEICRSDKLALQVDHQQILLHLAHRLTCCSLQVAISPRPIFDSSMRRVPEAHKSQRRREGLLWCTRITVNANETAHMGNVAVQAGQQWDKSRQPPQPLLQNLQVAAYVIGQLKAQ